jgi:hypothetical protein
MFPQKMQEEQLLNAIRGVQAKYAEPMASQDLQKAKLYNQYYGPNIQSEMGFRNAQTSKLNMMTPLEAQELKLKNQFYPDLTKAQMNMYNMGGRGGIGTGGREELMFQSFVSKDNPQLGNDPAKIYEASNVLRQGGNKLSDGTPINPLSPAAQSSLDRVMKSGTTTGALTPLLNAVGAEKEIDVLSDYAQKGLKPYGTTILNMNPDQIMDSFKSDAKSQLKLGKFIAAQQLQFEIAQNQTRIAMGQPGITNTQELMHRSQQSIDAKFPRLSYAARQEANRYFIDALKEGLKARQKAGISPSKALMPNSSSESQDVSQMSDEELMRIANGQ